jgi:6-phosphogluconolactonase
MDPSLHVYLGATTAGPSQGIYHAVLDTRTGLISKPELAVELSSPTFFCVSRDAKLLYTNGRDEPEAGTVGSTVTALAIDQRTGALTIVGSQDLEEVNFCHISLDLTGTVLLGVDYGTATVAAFPLDKQGAPQPAGTILRHGTAKSVVPDRQDRPHVHSINVGRSNRYAYVCDFSADEITTYRLSTEDATLEKHSTAPAAPGAGPRHLAVHPDRDLLYVINELGGTVTVYRADDGVLTEMQTIGTLPEEFSGHNTAAEIAISPDRRFLYGTNRGHESVAHYSIDSETGLLTFAGRTRTEGEHPRNFDIDPTGQFLIVSNRNTNNVVVFRIDQETGTPVATGQQIPLSVAMAVRVISLTG